MKKFFVTELYPHARHTVGVWREDVETILQEEGYQMITLVAKKGILQKLKAYFSAYRQCNKLPKNAIVFVHFPLRSRVIRFFVQHLNKKNIRCITLIHDLEGLRDEDDQLLQIELKWLRKFTVVIAQNDQMKDWLVKKSIDNIISLGFHDALYGEPGFVRVGTRTSDVCFAGNLQKANFVQKLNQLSNIRFHIYGKAVTNQRIPNVSFYGEADPVELPGNMKGSFGLVWDGNELTTCSGNYGKYLAYNTPYKMTAYVLAGLPMIVWDKSAMADWVLSKKIGITVASLRKLADAIDCLREEDYQLMKQNLLSLRKSVRQGLFFKEALHEAENLLFS